MKKAIALGMAVLMAFGLAGCAGSEPEQKENDNPIAENRMKLLQFDYGDVSLGEGMFKDTYDEAKAYYLGISVDDMFYGIRRLLYLNTRTGKDLGNFGTGSNVLGQWISGNARFCAALGTPELKARAKEIASALDEITAQSAYLIDGNSCYTFEKYLQGALDLYLLCGEEQAFTAAKRMVDAAMNDSVFTDAKKQLGDNGSPDNPRELEWYIMAESLYVFADAAKKHGCAVTEVRNYLNFAKSFEYTEFWNIFEQKKNVFDYKPVAGQNTDYFHAYSHLNSFNSAAGAYAATGNEYYLRSMLAFYAFMREKQEMATGGFGPHVEWILPEEEIVKALTYYHDNYENQCDTYAVYRLGNRLAAFTGEAQYGNWSEKLLYNSTIASLETRDGYAFYYSDYCASGGQKQLRGDWRWACCAGSRPLNVNEVLRTIYYHDTKNLYVNLFVNSSVSVETDAGAFSLSQQTDFPESDTVTVTVQSAPQETAAVKFRKPEWLSAAAQAKVNGEPVSLSEDAFGWLSLKRLWSAGDTIELTLPAALTVSRFRYTDEFGTEGVFAINYGAVALAANTPNPLGDPAKILNADRDIRSQLQAGETPLTFTAKEDESLQFKPFYSYKEGERYYLYIKLGQEEKKYD